MLFRSDINTLMANAAKGDFDVMAIQYTYPPVDPYADVAWLLGGEGSWTGYGNDKINEALSKVSLTDDVGQLKELYSIVDRQVQEDVPMFSAYIIKDVYKRQGPCRGLSEAPTSPVLPSVPE